jgi:hypothetical protein
MASSRIQRWALTLSAYHYTIQYRPGNKLSNADALSRLPLKDVPAIVPTPADVTCVINHLSDSVVTASEIATWTNTDPVLSRVKRFIQSGWTVLTPNISVNRKLELSIVNGCILWGFRVVIPEKGREKVLQ